MAKVKSTIPNKYRLVQETEPTPDCMYYSLGEKVREAFVGLTNNLFDHIRITPYGFGNCVSVEIVGGAYISLCAGMSFDFLSSSKFTFRPDKEEKWELTVDGMKDGFGHGMGVTAETPRKCILAMIQERKKFIKKTLKDLNKFRNFEDYTRLRYLYG
jgi:hypothetical protein